MKIESIIAPVHKSLLKMELTEERFLRPTNKGRNEIYIVDSANSPNIMWEIGRLREIAFRASGGGTGKSADIDEFDTMDEPCQQLIVWNPEAEEIIGGYRFLLGENMSYDNDGTPHIAMSHMFRYSDKFLKEYLPYTIELGRSFVSVDYQSTKAGAKRAHRSLSADKIPVRKDDHVPELSGRMPRHDIVFPRQIFPRRRKPRTAYPAAGNQHKRQENAEAFRGRQFQGRLPHTQHQREGKRDEHPAFGEFIYEPVAENEIVRHGHQRRVRRRRGNRHILFNIRHIRG